MPVGLTVSCDPLEPDFPFSVGSATIRQVVSGKNIAHGTATLPWMTCDGAPHDYVADVFHDDSSGCPSAPQSPLFSKGDAVVSAYASTYTSSATAGPQTIKLTK